VSRLRKSRTEKMQFYYKSGDFNDCVFAETALTEHSYTPYWAAFNQHLQGIIFCFYDLYKHTVRSARGLIDYDREVFTTSDGAKIAVEWYQGIPDPLTTTDTRPILVCISGLGSDTQATYIKRIIRELSSDFKCVFV